MSLAPCPIGRHFHPDPDHRTPPCATMLQSYQGRLSAGIAQHLMVVHELDETTATAMAAGWIKAGCRASG